jgi:hypothetical protein
MSQIEVSSKDERGFLDRRDPYRGTVPPMVERRQFSNSHFDLSPDAQELAQAIDSYKLHHRRRFISYEEILSIVKQLGYDRP